MSNTEKFYIDGKWVEPQGDARLDVINPATEEACGRIALGNEDDVNAAVAAAKAAFPSYSRTTRQERVELLQAIVAAYQARYQDVAATISQEMGAPISLAVAAQAAAGMGHFQTMAGIIENFAFESVEGSTGLVREPVGVCGFITPWNWPVNQIACKVAPALGAGCTMVLKPSEVAPLNAHLLAEILDAAGVPAGVFNLVDGDGPGVGEALARHPDVDMMSFTGSTRAGKIVAKLSADTVKRVAQELGGKSANVILDDADFEAAVTGGVRHCFNNSGQSCNAPTRMLVPEGRQDEVVSIAKAVAESVEVGDPSKEGAHIGPVVSKVQFDRIQDLIGKGIDEGATLVTGGLGKPDGMNVGYYVRPTVFANVHNDMTIAREEVFGPVLAILPYKDEDEAVAIANDTPYGLAGYVQSGDMDRARRVAGQLRAGQVNINGAGPDMGAPFGGYKQSGNGREWGVHGLEEFLEVKAVLGYAA